MEDVLVLIEAEKTKGSGYTGENVFQIVYINDT